MSPPTLRGRCQASAFRFFAFARLVLIINKQVEETVRRLSQGLPIPRKSCQLYFEPTRAIMALNLLT